MLNIALNIITIEILPLKGLFQVDRAKSPFVDKIPVKNDEYNKYIYLIYTK